MLPTDGVSHEAIGVALLACTGRGQLSLPGLRTGRA